MKIRILVFLFGHVFAISALAFSEKGDYSEMNLFCQNAKTVLLQQYGLHLNFENCLKQNLKVEIGQFFHPMKGIVIVKPDSNQLVQAFSCSMVYGGLAEDNDVIEAITCIE